MVISLYATRIKGNEARYSCLHIVSKHIKPPVRIVCDEICRA